VSAEEDVTVSATDKAPSVTGLIMTVALYTGRIQLYPHSLTSTHLRHQYTLPHHYTPTSSVHKQHWSHDDKFRRFDRTLACDRQTDRETERQTDRHTAISYTELA